MSKQAIIGTVEKMLKNIKSSSETAKNPQAIAIAYGTLIDIREKSPPKIRAIIDEVCEELLVQIERASESSKSPSNIAVASAILLTKFNKKISMKIGPKVEMSSEDRNKMYDELEKQKADKVKSGTSDETEEFEEDL